jgi:hypothetical protein
MTVQERLDADTLRWASAAVQRHAEQRPRDLLPPAGFAALEEVAVFLSAAAHRVSRGEPPWPFSTLDGWEVDRSPSEPVLGGVTPAVVGMLISQLLALKEAATPGDWYFTSTPYGSNRWMSAPSPLQGAVLGEAERERQTLILGTISFSQANQAYVCAAVNAVPILVGEIERLQKLVR